MHKRLTKSSPSEKQKQTTKQSKKVSARRTSSASQTASRNRTRRQFSTTTPSNTAQFTGSIHLIMGPMFSGKTTSLLEHYNKSVDLGQNPILIKHSSDTRYHGKAEVVTHDNRRADAISAHLLSDEHLTPILKDRSHVFVDEGQFFPDLDIMVDSFANNGKQVVVAALDGTFQREAFPVIANLIPKVEKLTKLTSSCHTCGEDAPFSKRLSADQEVHVIGGADKYQAACRKHYFHESAV